MTYEDYKSKKIDLLYRVSSGAISRADFHQEMSELAKHYKKEWMMRDGKTAQKLQAVQIATMKWTPSVALSAANKISKEGN